MKDDLDARLASLATPALDDAARDRALAAGLDALERTANSRLDRWVAVFERAYGKLEPALVVLVAIVDVTWAIRSLGG